MQRAPLRVGVLLDSLVVPAWKLRLLLELRAEPTTQVDLVIRVAAPASPVRTSAAFRAYEALDRRLFRSPRDPLAPCDAAASLASVDELEASLVPCAGGLEFSPWDANVLSGRHLDALLQLGSARLAGNATAVARLGLWSFAHEDEAHDGLAPFFGAMATRDPVTEVRLLQRTPAAKHVLYRSFASTNPNSLDRNRSGPLWTASELPLRALRAFADGREPPFDGGPTRESDTRRSARPPRATDVGRLVATRGLEVARNRSRLRRADRVWFIAVRRATGAAIESDPLDGFTPLPCPPDRFHADPVLVHDGTTHHLFFEDADRASGHGSLAWCALDEAGRPGPIRRILEMDTHLSYPSVFRWGDAWFMIPETSERRTVELHRAVEFPLRWRLEKVLFHDVAAVDATPFFHGGRLWLFLALSASGASLNDELFLFHADSPTGPWTPHPMNPVVSDVRRARPAGPLFRDHGALYRPGQDCAGDYGAAFWLNRVLVLDERSYRETPVRRIDAGWHPGGLCTHTFTRAGALEAMDNRIWRPREAA